MQAAYKMWLDENGKVFGEGVQKLLETVGKTGSLHQAAIELEMSYRTAWCMVRKVEKRLGFALLTRKTGGKSGGGSVITPEAKNLMEHYEAFHQELDEVVASLYKKHFESNESEPFQG